MKAEYFLLCLKGKIVETIPDCLHIYFCSLFFKPIFTLMLLIFNIDNID